MTQSIDYRTCPLCEATCGLEVTHDGNSVIRIRGDREDVFSHGYICPKGSTLSQLDEDPDRLRTPLIKEKGVHRPAGWDEAFALVEERMAPLVAEHGPNVVGVYLGNPNVHSMSGSLYNRVFLKMLRTRAIFSAATVDQMPKHVSSGLMFGHPDLIPVPDIDRTAYLLMLGANPLESNGSLATAPDWPGRLAAIRGRGGKVVVVDPRRTRTAEVADEHIFIRPGTDALLLAAMTHVLYEDGLVSLGDLSGHVAGADLLGAMLEGFSPERVAGATGIDPGVIRRLASELSASESGVVYGRIGTHTTEFGTLASWLVDVLNILTGNLDRPGGAMFPLAAHEQPRRQGGFKMGRWVSRARGLPETRGELPVSTLADEILEPGDGRLRALFTIAGNPALSAPNSDRLEQALGELEFMVSLDIYLNETTRHADVIFPGVSPLRRSHYDFAFNGLSVRNVANYSPPLFPLPEDTMDEWQILLRLGATLTGQGSAPDIGELDDAVFGMMVGSAVADPASKVHGRSPEEIFAMTDGDRGPERYLDFLVRTGPYGDGYGPVADGLSLRALRDAPHGIDLGPLKPRLPGSLMTASGKIELTPPAIVDDIGRLERRADLHAADGLVLVGRRHVRSNNSWMHNIDVLLRGRERCTLEMNPVDAERMGVGSLSTVKVTSDAGTLVATLTLTDTIMPGVVSLPHGWGHDRDGARLRTAATRPGVNSNRLSTGDMDPVSGNAVLNGISVEVVPA
ncbi:MAG: molybdopterin-dependent oxidoreductase [Acidimicrobiia bacterium]